MSFTSYKNKKNIVDPSMLGRPLEAAYLDFFYLILSFNNWTKLAIVTKILASISKHTNVLVRTPQRVNIILKKYKNNIKNI
jgi:hypothetical protein